MADSTHTWRAPRPGGRTTRCAAAPRKSGWRCPFVIDDSFAAGGECANVGTITSYLAGGVRIDTEGVLVYRVGADGRLKSMRGGSEPGRRTESADQLADSARDIDGGAVLEVRRHHLQPDGQARLGQPDRNRRHR